MIELFTEYIDRNYCLVIGVNNNTFSFLDRFLIEPIRKFLASHSATS